MQTRKQHPKAKPKRAEVVCIGSSRKFWRNGIEEGLRTGILKKWNGKIGTWLKAINYDTEAITALGHFFD